MGSGSAAEAQQLHAYLQSRGYVHAARGLLEDMRDAGHTPGPACAAMEESQSAPAVGPAEVKMTTPNDGAGRSARRRPSAGTGDPAVSSAKCAAATPSPNAPSRAGRTAAPERHSGAALVDVGGGVMCELEEADAAEFEGLQTGQAQGVVFRPHADAAECLSPVASPGALLQREPFETLQLPFISAPMRSSLEETVNYPIEVGGVVVGRYRIVDYLGQGVFSRAVQCIDLQSGQLVCLKITRNNKDFFDMGLMEVKVLRLLNEHDPSDEMHVLRLLSFFYHKEHLFFVCELLRDNLYELYRYVSCSPSMQPYFTLPRVRSIAHQCLVSLAYIHSFGLIHCDLKPENIVIQSFSRCRIKVIDFGSSTFPRDPHSSYVQSRSYRAPEVLLGLPYGVRIDIWSLGCILAELFTSRALFSNKSTAELIAAQVALCGDIPPEMIESGYHSAQYFRHGRLFTRRGGGSTGPEASPGAGGDVAGAEPPPGFCYLRPIRKPLSEHLGADDALFVDMLSRMLQPDMSRRISAVEALRHPWFSTPTMPAPVLYSEGCPDSIAMAKAVPRALRMPAALRAHLKRMAPTTVEAPPLSFPAGASATPTVPPGTACLASETAASAAKAHVWPVDATALSSPSPPTDLGGADHSAPACAGVCQGTCGLALGASTSQPPPHQPGTPAPAAAAAAAASRLPDGCWQESRPQPAGHAPATGEGGGAAASVPTQRVSVARAQPQPVPCTAQASSTASSSGEGCLPAQPVQHTPPLGGLLKPRAAAAPGGAGGAETAGSLACGPTLGPEGRLLGTEPPGDAGTGPETENAAPEALDSEPSWGTSAEDADSPPKAVAPRFSRQSSIWGLTAAESAKMTPSLFRRDAAKERQASAGAGPSVSEDLRACMLHRLDPQEAATEDDQEALRRCFQALRGLLPRPSRPKVRRERISTNPNRVGTGSLSEGTSVLQPRPLDGDDTLGGPGLPDIAEEAAAATHGKAQLPHRD